LKVFLVVILLTTYVQLSHAGYNYDIGIPKEYGVVAGAYIQMPGRIVNTGYEPLHLLLYGGGMCVDADLLQASLSLGLGEGYNPFFSQLRGKILAPGESIDFVWFSGYVPRDPSVIDGSKYWGSFLTGLPPEATWRFANLLLPYDGQQHEYFPWTSGTFRASENQLPVEFQYTRIDDTFVRYIDAAPVPVPSAVWLLGSGLAGALATRKKLIRRGVKKDKCSRCSEGC
jgi:hypothetical protein